MLPVTESKMFTSKIYKYKHLIAKEIKRECSLLVRYGMTTILVTFELQVQVDFLEGRGKNK